MPLSKIWHTTFFAVVIAPLMLHGVEDNQMISTSRARQHGMEVQWFSQIQVNPHRGSVIEMFLQVDEDRATTLYELTHDGHRHIYSEFDRNPRGEVFGREGAKEWANLQLGILKEKNIDAELKEYVRPKSTLYALTSQGLIQSINAETGRTNWAVGIGNPKYPSTGLAANNDFVAVVNGSRVYCLDAETGLTVWDRQCKSGPSGGVAISQNYIFVTEVNGMVQGFPLNGRGIPTTNFISFGRALVKPLITDLTVSWPSDRGYYNVGSANAPDTPAYHFRTDSTIVCPGISVNDQLIFAANDGKTYALDEKTGATNWEFSSGDPISNSPATFGGSIYVVTDLERLFKINSTDGNLDSKWPRGIAGIRRFVAASQNQVYFIDRLNNLVAFNRTTGARTMSIPVGTSDLFFSNTHTDRIYIGTHEGSLQCLREQGNFHPHFHADEPVQVAADKEKANVVTDGANPFGEEAGTVDDGGNPFGEEDDGGMEDDGDPFGGGSEPDDGDPFGGGDDSSDEDDGDPFGG